MKRIADILRIDRLCAYVVWALYAAPTVMIIAWAAKMRSSRSAVVVVSAEEWERKAHRSGNLAEFFAESPLRGSDLKITRTKDVPREVDL